MSKSILNIHLEILDSARKDLLDKLIPVISGFTLGGGTALALQINHRRSFDFDFFSSSPIQKNFLDKLSRVIDIGNIIVDTTDELTIFTKDDIKITFLYYPFISNFEAIKLEIGLNLFSVPEIAVQKAYTIGRRGEYRDYFDLFSILKENYIELQELIRIAKKVYGGVFDEKIFLEQLVYFNDLTNFEINPVGNKKISEATDVKNFFEELVRNSIEKGKVST